MAHRRTTRSRLFLLAGAGVLLCVLLLLRAANAPDTPHARVAPVPDAVAGAVELDAPGNEGDRATARVEHEPPASEAQAREARLVIAIRDADGAPLPGTRAIAFRSSGILWSELADDRGEIAVPALAEPAEIVLVPRGAMPARRDVPAGEARREITLAEGAVVAGRLLVDGGPPSEPVRLVLVSDHPILDLEGIPSDVRALLESSPGAPLVVRSATGEGGTFHFRGLAARWSGCLYFPVEYIPVRAQPEGRIERSLVRLDRAAESLTIETTRLPMLTGRLVEAGSRTSAVGVEQTVMLRKEGDDNTTVVAPTDQEGRFSVPILESGFLRAELYIEPRETYQSRFVAFTRESSEGDWDLGEIELQRLGDGRADIEVRVVDPDGAPVEGAAVWFAEDPQRTSVRTDALGRSVVAWHEPFETLIVAALGFAIAEERVQGEVESPRLVELSRACLLSLRVVTAGGSAAGLILRVEAKEPMFTAGTDWWPDSRFRPTPATRGKAYGPDDDGGYAEFALDEGDTATIADLRPGVVLELFLVDRLGRAVWSASPFALATAERRELTCHVDADLRELRGTVVDEMDRPIVYASLRISAETGKGTWITSDSSGAFHAPSLLAEPVSIEVQKQGYVALKLPELVIPADGEAVTLRLVRGLSVVVRVLDEEGQSVEAAVSASSASEEWIPSIREELGVHRLDDLAAEDLRVEAHVGGQIYAVQHDARVPDCELRVPVHGSIHVRLESGLEWGEDERAVVVMVSLAEGRGEPRSFRIDRATTELELGPLLPGDYTLFVESISTRDGAERWVELSRKRSAQVRAHEITTVVLGP